MNHSYFRLISTFYLSVSQRKMHRSLCLATYADLGIFNEYKDVHDHKDITSLHDRLMFCYVTVERLNVLYLFHVIP
jgi:hypothetical protein